MLTMLTIGVAALYVTLAVLLYWKQAHLIFFPSAQIDATPADFGAAFEDVNIPMPGNDGMLHGWWMPAASPRGTLLYFHGNAGNVGVNAAHAARFQTLGLNVLLFDYRGYGRSAGAFPSEKSVYEDADAVWRYVTESRQIPAWQIILYGHSLGGAVAIETAVRHPEAAGLITESTFTSIDDMAREQSYRIFPLALLLTNRFESLEKIARVRMPTLFIHGENDSIVPTEMSRRLHASSAAKVKALLLVPGADHEDTARVGGAVWRRALSEFIDAALPAAAAKRSKAANSAPSLSPAAFLCVLPARGRTRVPPAAPIAAS